MFWHQDEAEDQELTTASQSLEASREDDSKLAVIKRGFALIATEGKKMQIAGLLISL